MYSLKLSTKWNKWLFALVILINECEFAESANMKGIISNSNDQNVRSLHLPFAVEILEMFTSK